MRRPVRSPTWLILVFGLALISSGCAGVAYSPPSFRTVPAATTAVTPVANAPATANPVPAEPSPGVVPEAGVTAAKPGGASEATVASSGSPSPAAPETGTMPAEASPQAQATPPKVGESGLTPTPIPKVIETSSPSNVAGPDISAAAASSPEPASTGQTVLYRDDFTDIESGWPDNLEFGSYYIGYHEPDRYHVEVHTPHDRALVAVPERSFGDFTVDAPALVEPNNTAQTGDFRYGLFFRRSGNQYYAFAISPRTKTWYVLKSSPTGLVELAKGSNDTIQGLTGDDRLRVDVQGPKFFFHINDQLLGEVSDSEYSSGETGFYVETFDSPRVHIHYGTITVRDVDAPQLQCNVIAQALRMRVGPGTDYPIITSLSSGVLLTPIARSPGGQWIQVRPEGSDRTGWVASSPELVTCSVPLDSLPLPSG